MKLDMYNKGKILSFQYAARDIYNVGGDMKVVHDAEEENRIFLKQLSRIDYSKQLKDDYNSKKIIKRDALIKNIIGILEEDNKVLIHGKPGIGKSIILKQIEEKYDSIYVSFNSTSEKKVLLYLLSKILSDEEIENIKLLTLENILNEFEIILQSTKKLFIFDDCEKIPKLLEKIHNLECFSNKFLYSSRNVNSKITNYEIVGFSELEMKEFIEINKISLDLIKVEELFHASEGNPLYLYYFSKSPTKKIPKGLEKFQEALWDKLNDLQKEILILISLTIFPIEFEQIKNSIEKLNEKKYTPQEFNRELEEISYLINKQENNYLLFHNTLSEFLIEKLNKQGSLLIYKKILGNVMLESNEYLDAVNLLMDIEPNKIKNYIFYTASIINDLGLFDLGIKILNKAIEFFKIKDEIKKIGMAYNLLGNFYRDIYQLRMAIECNENAIICFKKNKNEEHLNIAKLSKAINLMEINETEEAMKIVEEIEKQIEIYSEKNRHYQSALYVDLAKFYIDSGVYEKALNYAKISYEIFKESEDLSGIKASLSNIIICCNFLDTKLSIEYGNIFIELLEKTQNIRILASTYNALTSSYRKTKEYEKAIEYGKKAVNASLQIKSELLFVVNLLNLGNVYRDINDTKEALSIYLRGKKIAEDNHILKEEVRALKLITEIYIKANDIETAYIYAEECLEKSLKCKIYYRIYEANFNLAHILFLKKESKWKEYFEEGINIYEKFEEKEDVIMKILYYLNIFGEELTVEDIEFCYKYIFKNLSSNSRYDKIFNNVLEQVKIDNFKKINSVKKILENYIKFNSKVDIKLEMILFVLLCREQKDITIKKDFYSIMDMLVENLKNEQIVLILIVMLVQTQTLLEYPDILLLIEKISSLYKGFYFRETSNQEKIFTFSVTNNIKFQIISLNNNLFDLKISFMLTIIFKFYWQLIEKEIKKLSSTNFSLILENIDLVEEKIKNEISKKIDQESPFIFLGVEGKNYKGLILDKKYEKYLDYNENEKPTYLLTLIFDTLMIFFKEFDEEFEIKSYPKICMSIIKKIFLNKESEGEKFELNLNLGELKKDLKNIFDSNKI